MKKTFYYARVSTKGQHEDRQLAAFYALGAEDRDIVIDKESGKTLDRKGYTALKETMLRDGDVLVVKSLDRLSRRNADIKKELEYFKAHNIRVKILDIPSTLVDPPEGQEWVMEMVNNILIEVLGTIAEQEVTTKEIRQREGIAAAHQRGVKFGRPRATYPKHWEEVIEQMDRGSLTATSAITVLKMSRTTFYKLLKEYREEQNRT